jgi:hypothetical protein
MATFVMNFSMKKMIEAQKKDKVILKAWTSTSNLSNATVTVKQTTEISIAPKKKFISPFYTAKNNDVIGGNYRWLIK